MRVMSWIPVTSIKVDRSPLNPTVLRLCLHLAKKGTVPPIKVQYGKDGLCHILDGRHRVTAHKLLGRKFILARYSREEQRETKVEPSNFIG